MQGKVYVLACRLGFSALLPLTFFFFFFKSWPAQLCFKGCMIGSLCHTYCLKLMDCCNTDFRTVRKKTVFFYLDYHKVSNLWLSLSHSNHCIWHTHLEKNNWREEDLLLTRCRETSILIWSGRGSKFLSVWSSILSYWAVGLTTQC